MKARKALAALPYNPMPDDDLVRDTKTHHGVFRKQDVAEKKARQI